MKKKTKSLGKKAMKRTKGGASPGQGQGVIKHKLPQEVVGVAPIYKNK